MKALIILISLCGFFVTGLFAQNSIPDSTQLLSAIKNQRMRYHNDMGSGSSLNNGSLYKETVYRTKKNEIPYFLSDDWIDGSVNYGGQLYEQLDLQYDLVNNKIISHPFYSLIKMELVYDRIESFTLGDHKFIRLSAITKDNYFYDELISDSVKLYALRKIDVLEELNPAGVTHVFVDKTKYFILSNGTLKQVKGRRDLLSAFSAHRSEIKKHLPSKSAFRKNPEETLKGFIRYYNTQNLK